MSWKLLTCEYAKKQKQNKSIIFSYKILHKRNYIGIEDLIQSQHMEEVEQIIIDNY